MEGREQGLSGGFSRPWLPFAAIAALCAYLWWHFQYPFYFIWDMDHTVLVDTVLMQSGKWPVHLHHPGFGMYLPLKFSHWLAHLAGFVSVLNLDDLKNSLGPILGVAEATDYLRIHSPFVALAAVLLLWRALSRLFALSAAMELAFFTIIATQAAFSYHSTMIRTELYALFWWAAAVYAFVRSAQASGAKGEALWAAAGGCLLSLSLLSKIQALIYVVAGVALLELFRRSQGKAREANPWVAPKLRRLCSFNLIFSFFLIIAGALRRPYGATFTENYPINVTGLGLLAASIGLWLLGRGQLGAIRAKLGRFGEEWLWLSTVILAGFLMAYLTHFLAYANPATSYRYMLLDAKMVFFRNSTDPGLLNPGARIDNFSQLLFYNPLLYVVFAVSMIVVFLRAGNRLRLKAGLSALIFLCLISAVAGSRAFLRDLLWAETLVLVLILWAVGITGPWVGRSRYVLASLLALVLAGNAHSLSRLRRDLDANYNLYGWSPHRNFDGTYWDGHVQFAPPIHARYGPEGSQSRTEAFLQARAYRDVRRTAAFVFANARLSMKNLGLCAEGQSVFAADPVSRFGNVPEALRGGTVVDASDSPLDGHVLYEPKRVNQNDERLDKRSGFFDSNSYAVLARPDLDIFVATKSDLSDLVGFNVLEAAGNIELAVPAGASYRLYRVVSYLQVVRGRLGARHFFVIKQKLDK